MSKRNSQSFEKKKNLITVTDLTGNEILSFFTFCSVFKIKKNVFDIIILLTNVFGDIGRSVKLPKTIQNVYEKIIDKRSMLVTYVG